VDAGRPELERQRVVTAELSGQLPELRDGYAEGALRLYAVAGHPRDRVRV